MAAEGSRICELLTEVRGEAPRAIGLRAPEIVTRIA
jgi:hypothetical protein